jgi:serine/threonine protein kinase
MLQCPKCQAQTPPEATYCIECGSSLELREGVVLNDYQIEKFLGSGAMGEVWRATHPVTRKRAAVKVLRQDLLLNVNSERAKQSLLTRFMREAQAVNQIETQKHHFVEIFSYGTLKDARPYLMMDYLQGEELSTYIQRLGPLPFSKILEFTEQISLALDAAHQHEPSIIHRDLKPQNIFLLEQNKGSHLIKILDFGLAKLGDENSITRTGSRMGTPLYMSPEQCHSAKHVDHRTDQYSLGVIVYEMLTGRTPFGKQRNTQADIIIILEQHIGAKPPPMSSTVDGRVIQPAIEAVVMKALSKDPTHRFDTCSQFFAALEEAIGEERTQSFEQVKDAKPNYESEALLLTDETKTKTEDMLAKTIPSETFVPPKEKGGVLLYAALAIVLVAVLLNFALR